MPLKSAALDTRQAVLNEARSLFALKGYAAVSMRDIAGAVGMQQSSIYNHFDSKQSLLFDLLNEHMSELHRTLLTVHNAESDVIEQFVQFARFHIEFHIDFPNDVFIAYMELRSLEANNREVIVERRNAYERVLRNIIQQGVSCGDFHCVDAAVHTRAVIAMLTGVTVWYRANGSLDKATVVQSYVVAALQSLGVSPQRLLQDHIT